MPHVMVRYRVHPDRVAENEELVRAVYDELAASQPDGLQYATLKLPDGVTFIHLAAARRAQPVVDDGRVPTVPEGIDDRCDEPPVVTQAEAVGSYRFFEAGQ